MSEPLPEEQERELLKKYKVQPIDFIRTVRELTKNRWRNGKLERWDPAGPPIEPISEEERKWIDEELENPYTTEEDV